MQTCMHVKFHYIMLFTFNSYILSKTIVSIIHVPYNQNLIEILQTFPQQRAGHHLVIPNSIMKCVAIIVVCNSKMT